jgi:D-alanine--poly(phosphoribitol) ligase subunit 2
MKRQDVMDVVLPLVREKDNFKNIGLDDDYFDSGVSSLTIIGLQIQVEEKLGVAIETRELMGFSTINHWIDAYTAKLEATPSPA